MTIVPQPQPEASEALWLRFREPLRRFVLSRVRDAVAADDILQEVFLKLHTQAVTLRDTTRIGPWLFRVTSNAIADHFRAPSPLELDERASEAIAASEAEDDAEARIGASLLAMIDDLPESYREAVRLIEIEGVPQAELAARLGMSVSGAKSRVQRGREKLRQLLVDCCHVEFDRRGNVIAYEKRPPCCRG